MTVLAAHDLKKSFGPQTILDGASCAIEERERVGLVGINGSGKSTLGKVLAGIEAPDGGTVMRARGGRIAYLEQDPRFDGDATAHAIVASGLDAWSEAKARHDAASAALGKGEGDLGALVAAQEAAASDIERLGGWSVGHQVDTFLGHLGIERVDAAAATMSGGERRRVALARLLIMRPALAILDEPSNHLDVDAIEWLEEYLAEEHPGAVLLITHDRALLDRVVDRTLEIDAGKVHAYEGGYEAYLEAKAERLEHLARTESNRQNFLRTELEWLRRQPKARSTKQKARIQRAEAAKAAPPPKQEKTVELALDASRSGKTVLALEKITLRIGDRDLVKDLELTLTPGERVGVLGKNGTGKTTLLRAITGEVKPSRGAVVIGKNTKIAYFDQHKSDLEDDKSIFDNVMATAARVNIGGEDLDVRTYLERFLFDPYKQRQQVGALSGGERARVALAKLLAGGANLLLLDEPTNDLDLATLAALEDLLLRFGGSTIVVTHDRYFLNRVATSTLAFEGDGRVVRYGGGYDDYRAQRARAEDARRAASEPPPARNASTSAGGTSDGPKAKTKLTFAETRELDALPAKIEEVEKKVAALEAKLADPTLYSSRGAEVPKLSADLEAAKADASKLLARWEELETKREAAR